MKLLRDTCVFLWLATEPSKLSQAATTALDDEQNELFLSDVSINSTLIVPSTSPLTRRSSRGAMKATLV